MDGCQAGVSLCRRHKALISLVSILVLLLSCNLFYLHQHTSYDALLWTIKDEPPVKTQIFLFDSSSLLLRGVRMNDLNRQWIENSTYGDLLRLSQSTVGVHPKQAMSRQQQNATSDNRVVMLWHAVPKTAGTTVRRAIFKHMDDTCPNAGEAATQQGAFRSVATLHQLITNCINTSDFGLGGRMTFRPLENNDGIIIVHTLAFRNYEEWANSALNQIVKVFGVQHCKTVREYLRECEDYRELSFYQYTKTQLKRIRKSLSKQNIVIVYNYRDTDLFHSTIRSQLDMPPLKLETYNTNRTTEKCPDDVLEMFYNCHEL